MADSAPQTYKTHRKFVPLFHFILLPFLLFYVIRSLWLLYQSQTLGEVVSVLLAAALLVTALFARTFALGVQDRLICLEMRLRLHEVLPEELRARISDLEPSQLVGLRFASTAELPALAGRVLNGELKGREEIKKAIQNWQLDPVRI